MNHPALIFRRLSTVWRRDTADEALEGLAADFAARVAAAGGFVCVALLAPRELAALCGLAGLLYRYRLSLYCQRRRHDDRMYLFARLESFPRAEARRARLPGSPIDRRAA